MVAGSWLADETWYFDTYREMFMKKRISLLFLLCILLPSCTADEPQNLYDLLQISTRVWTADLEDAGRWGYDQKNNKGYWIPNDGMTELSYDDVFVMETLEEGVVRTMAPMGPNLSLTIEFEGTVKVKKLEPADSSIRIVHFDTHGWTDLNDVTLSPPCTLNICPVGKILSTEATTALITTDTLVDKEYTLEIQGCTLGGQSVVTAVVKITSIPDP